MGKHKKAPKRKAEELTKIRRKMRRLESKLRKCEPSSDSDISTSSIDSSVDSEQENGSSSIDGENRDMILPARRQIYGSLATRWNNYLQNGIEKELKTKLFDNQQIPKNCLFLEAPTLNPEVQAMISAKDAKKDAFIMELQYQLGKGMSALGTVISKTLEKSTETNPENPDKKLASLVEAGKMLCTEHHAMTNHRKLQMYPNFNNKILKIAASQSRDNMLFGEDFGEKCKSAKNLELSAKEMRATTSSNSKNPKGYASKSRWKQEKRGGKTNYDGSKTSGFKTTYTRSNLPRAKYRGGQRLGFLINLEKSCLHPTQALQYLGFIFNSKTMTISPTKDKKQKIRDMTNKLLNQKKVTIRFFSRFIGHLISVCLATRYGWLNTKQFERQKYLVLKSSHGNYDKTMEIPCTLKDD
nr:unnamed protein product [Callosobruchus analis]